MTVHGDGRGLTVRAAAVNWLPTVTSPRRLMSPDRLGNPKERPTSGMQMRASVTGNPDVGKPGRVQGHAHDHDTAAAAQGRGVR